MYELSRLFGWDYPPGVSRLPEPEDCICLACERKITGTHSEYFEEICDLDYCSVTCAMLHKNDMRVEYEYTEDDLPIYETAHVVWQRGVPATNRVSANILNDLRIRIANVLEVLRVSNLISSGKMM